MRVLKLINPLLYMNVDHQFWQINGYNQYLCEIDKKFS